MILYAEVTCIIYDAQSLKDKRSVIKRIIHRIQNDYNVAISEIDYQDLWQKTMFGIVSIANEKVKVERVVDQCLNLIDTFPEIERTTTEKQWL
ncbi:hypothetical protein Pryu01_00171 [Paraliobacillus ryukyuensis]|uniref:DUF503 family protein n=1 Tax=Paraliobacillus ryukyuensis TaxID=200904 RepID=A0A366EH80_9BACI|nr:DUF503 domain-containing protein [Paraliobacillus ryukyuensis]RBP01757.1 hypothetical protein DES48_101501 [Paraliobacillus ryukyuensis]